jgi:tRNA(Ile)-lysidine synthase
MLSRGDKVLLSISGGTDSLALWQLFLRFKPVLGLNLHVFHLNHMLRKEAEDDANFVRGLAEEAGIPSSIVSYDVPSYIAKHRLSTQEGARRIRYELLQDVAERIGADRIALGHHAEDQAETFLMWLLRGAGTEGLAGIPAVRGRYIRPLIETRRVDLEDYCKKHGLTPRIDPSNFDLAYERNRVRLELIPYLTTHYQPRLVEILSHTGQIIADEGSVISQLTQEKFKKLVRLQKNEVRIHIPALASLPVALRRRLLRRAIQEVKGDLRGIEFRHIESLVERISEKRKVDVDLPEGVAVFQEYEYLVVSSQEARKAEPFGKIGLRVPGKTEVPPLDIEIEASVFNSGQADIVQGPDTAFLDSNKVRLPLVVRSRRDGDVFVPLGMRDFKKLQDFLVDEKVPRRERDRIPVVESGEGIVWVAGYRIDDRFKVTAKTIKVLVLKLKREQKSSHRSL